MTCPAETTVLLDATLPHMSQAVGINSFEGSQRPPGDAHLSFASDRCSPADLNQRRQVG